MFRRKIWALAVFLPVLAGADPGAPNLHPSRVEAPRGQVHWEAALSELRDHPDQTAVLAWSPSETLLAGTTDQIKALIDRGQLQLSLRLPNDPVLPFLMNLQDARPDLSFSWPEDATFLLAQNRLRFEHAWGAPPEIFYPESGYWTPDLLAELVRFKFSALQTDQEILSLADIPGVPRKMPDLREWLGTPQQIKAWQELARVRAAAETFKNSGEADLGRIDSIFHSVYAAEASGWFSQMSAAAPNPDQTLTLYLEKIAEIYRMIKKPVPKNLFTPGSASSAPSVNDDSSGTMARLDYTSDGDPRLTLTAPGNALRNPRYYALDRIILQSTEDHLLVRAVVRMPGSGILGAGLLNPPLVDLYIDLNGRPRAGRTRTLADRSIIFGASKGWEYAMSVTGNQAALFRSIGSDRIEWEATYPARWDPILGELEWSIPRDRVQGDFTRWGYQALVGEWDPQSRETDFRLARRKDVPAVHDVLPADGMDAKILRNTLKNGTLLELPMIRYTPGN